MYAVLLLCQFTAIWSRQLAMLQQHDPTFWSRSLHSGINNSLFFPPPLPPRIRLNGQTMFAKCLCVCTSTLVRACVCVWTHMFAKDGGAIKYHGNLITALGILPHSSTKISICISWFLAHTSIKRLSNM